MKEVPGSELTTLFPGGEPRLRAGLGALEKGDDALGVIHDGAHEGRLQLQDQGT